MSPLTVCFSIIFAACIATQDSNAASNSESDVSYFFEMGEMGDTAQVNHMYPLSMHIDEVRRSEDNSDKKYFIRIATPKAEMHCWIKQISTKGVQLWSFMQPNQGNAVTKATSFEVQLNTNPTKGFVLPPNTKWECIINTETHTMNVYKLDKDASLDAVRQVRIAESEPIHIATDSITKLSGLNVENAASTPFVHNSNVNGTEPFTNETDPWTEHDTNRAQNINESSHALQELFHAQIKSKLTVATGSCLQQRFKRLTSFAAMAHYKPDIIVLSGDNVYLDMIPYQLGCACCLNNDEIDESLCPMWCFNWFWQVVSLNATAEYKRLLRHPDFPKSEDWNPIWLAVWDDHDYGKDNSDSSNPQKLVNKQAFIDFYMELNRNQPWMRSDAEIFAMTQHEDRGIYHHFNHRVMLTEGLLDVVFVMLDVRYHRTKTDMLGVAQWNWLEHLVDNINKNKPHWAIFVLGTTFLLEHPAIIKKIGAESWDIESKKRFEGFLDKTGMPRERILFLSGDVHFSVVHDANGLKEYTVSSFTHSLGPLQTCCGTQQNEFAISPVTCVNGYGLFEFTQNTYSFELKNSERVSHIPVQVNAQTME